MTAKRRGGCYLLSGFGRGHCRVLDCAGSGVHSAIAAGYGGQGGVAKFGAGPAQSVALLDLRGLDQDILDRLLAV